MLLLYVHLMHIEIFNKLKIIIFLLPINTWFMLSYFLVTGREMDDIVDFVMELIEAEKEKSAASTSNDKIEKSKNRYLKILGLSAIG